MVGSGTDRNFCPLYDFLSIYDFFVLNIDEKYQFEIGWTSRTVLTALENIFNT